MSNALVGREALGQIADALGLSTKGLKGLRIIYKLDSCVIVECDYIAKPDSNQLYIDTVVNTFKCNDDQDIKGQ